MATSFPPPELSSDNSQDGKVAERAKAHDENVLQKHVAFFDRNHDGIIYPWETYQGFRAIGCGILLSVFSAIFVNLGLSRKTRLDKSLSAILLPIEVKHIHKGKHGSDSGVYDSEGRFVPSKFEEIFAKHARKHPNALTSDELMGMLKANRVPKDYKGWLASYTEWKILYVLCKDEDGLLNKEVVRAVYDGTLFQRMEKEHSENKKNK
ncbi:putative peroxygenase 4 [Stylosanthes scabra]|uniref:Peroxygenase 4 n=1 Tax=Stylosanthes scabra TaxID=79078 RepID=A0ABU6VJ00_9FABA|nr:putative peroxygenase 4 [Stylosanthes scabra]